MIFQFDKMDAPPGDGCTSYLTATIEAGDETLWDNARWTVAAINREDGEFGWGMAHEYRVESYTVEVFDRAYDTVIGETFTVRDSRGRVVCHPATALAQARAFARRHGGAVALSAAYDTAAAVEAERQFKANR